MAIGGDEMGKKFVVMLAVFFIMGSLAASNNAGYNEKIKNGEKSVETFLFFSNKSCSSSLQPTVVITQPADGAVLHTRDVTVLGYATDETGMNYWE